MARSQVGRTQSTSTRCTPGPVDPLAETADSRPAAGVEQATATALANFTGALPQRVVAWPVTA